VSILIAHGAPIEQRDERGYTALMFAANAGHASVVRALLTAGADPGTTDLEASTPIMFAAQYGHDEVVDGGKCEHHLSGFQVPVDPASGIRASDDGGGRKV